MLTRIQRWLAPPVFEGDEDKTRSARVLNALLIILMVLLIFMVSIYVPFISVEKPFSLALVLVLIFALVVTRWQMQRGRVWLASVIWVCLMWIVVTVLLFFAGGMTSIAAVFYVAGTIIAGLLLGTRMASVHALACILAGLVMVILESIGRSLPRVFPLPPFAGWVGMIVSLSLAMIALNLVMRSLKGALELTRQQVEERRRAEEALRHREQEFKTLVENNPDMVARFDRAYRHTYVNPAVEKELGTPLESLLGKTHRELGMAPETADWSEDLIRQVFETGQEVTFELSMPTPSGVQHYLTRGVPEFAEDGTVASALFIHRNVTALKQAEEALRESEEKFSKAFQSSPLAVLITRLSDGQFIEVNQTFESFGGYRRDEVIGRTSLDLGLVNPEDRESAKRILQEHGSFKNSEARFYTKSGEERIGLFSGEVIEIGGEACIIQVVSDITERKQANEALRESEEQYRALVENSLLGVGISRGNQVIFANPALLRIFGYDNFEEFARVPLLDHVAPSSRELISERSKKMAQGEPMPVEFEYDIVRKDGEIRTLQASTSTVTLGDGNYRHTTFQDITKRKQTEEALRESEEKFSKAFQSSPLAVAITRMPDGQFIEVNQTFEVLSGYSRDEVIGLTSLDLGLINLEDREMGQRTLQELGSFRNLEIRFYTKSGEERIGLFSGELIEIGGEVRLMQVVSDITERVRTEEVRRQAEEALRESEERYRAMFDHMQSGVAVYQVIGDSDDFVDTVRL
jgi:PAS domain S-box-containing protein